MKRYRSRRITLCAASGDGLAQDITDMIEDPDGEWVKWEDAEKKREEGFKAGYLQGQHGTIVSYAACKGDRFLECNYLREAEQPTGLTLGEITYCTMWICPAHGYKRR